MKITRIIGLSAWTLLLAVGALLCGGAPTAHAGKLDRISADFNFTGEISTTDPIPGIPVYQKTVNVPGSANTLFVTLSTQGDGHDGAGHLFDCRVDGVSCSPDWVTLQRHKDGDDLHDNGIYYTWCKPITKGSHAVEIRMASDNGGEVFIENIHVYIDDTKLLSGNDCRQFNFPTAPLSSGSHSAQ